MNQLQDLQQGGIYVGQITLIHAQETFEVRGYTNYANIYDIKISDKNNSIYKVQFSTKEYQTTLPIGTVIRFSIKTIQHARNMCTGIIDSYNTSAVPLEPPKVNPELLQEFEKEITSEFALTDELILHEQRMRSNALHSATMVHQFSATQNDVSPVLQTAKIFYQYILSGEI